MSRYIPRPYQPDMSNHMLKHARCNVFAGMGVGKSPATMEALATLLLFGMTERVLIIAPRRVATSTWPDVISDFRDSFGWIKLNVAVGTEAQRRAAVEKPSHIVAINYDNLQWLVENYGETWPFDTVVCDESTRLRGLRVSIQTHKKSGKKFLAGQGGKRSKALARVAHTRVKRWINLTGTPTLAGLEALWGPQWFVDAGTRLLPSFTEFSYRWFRAVPGTDATRQVIEPLPYADEQIRNLIRDVTIVVEAKDHFNIKEPIENLILVDLPPAAQKQYKEMAQSLWTEINGVEIDAVSAAAKSQKLLQIASGAAYTDDQGNWTLVHDEKIKALESVVEEACGMPVLVFYHFKSDLARILKAFPKARRLDDDPQTIRDWNAGKIPMLVAHPASAGHGLSLQHGSNIACFFSTNWSAENDAQAIERIGPTRQAQSGYDRPVFIHRLIARGTVEGAAYERLRTRVRVQDALLAGLKEICEMPVRTC